MKKQLILVMALHLLYFAGHAQRKWDGGGDGISWSDPANWESDLIPAPADDVVLDNTLLASSFMVCLPGGDTAVSVNSLQVSPALPLQISIVLPATNTAATAFTATGPGDAITLNDGAVFRNSSGASSGTPVSVTAAAFFRINNGGHYIHNTARGHTNYLASRLSTAAGTELGVFELDVPGSAYTLSLSGRNYGTLVLSSATHAAPVTYSGGGASDLHIYGMLQLNPGTRFSSSLSGNIILDGPLVLQDEALFNIQSSGADNRLLVAGDIHSLGTITKSGSGLPILELNGTGNQDIAIAAFTSTIRTRVNNPAGVTLTEPLLLPGDLELLDGKIHSSAANLLTMKAGSVCTGGSSQSFVEGLMRKTGAEPFRFPVGAGTNFCPLELFNLSGEDAGDEFTASYVRANPQVTPPYAYNHPGIDHISYVEYWTLEQNAGHASKNISLSVNELSFARDITQTYICSYTGTEWMQQPSVSTLTGNGVNGQTGFITTTAGINHFDVFTLATDLPESINPLPVSLLYFLGERTPEGVVLRWKPATCCLADTRYQVYRSEDFRSFVQIGVIAGEERDLEYQFADRSPGQGPRFYKLRICSTDSLGSFSNILSVADRGQHLLIGQVSPVPANHSLNIPVYSSRESGLQLMILTAGGALVNRKQVRAFRGSNHIVWDLASLAAGPYFLVALSEDERSNVVAFLKR